MHPVVALVTAGVEMDVLGLTYAEYSDAEREAVVHAHPRSDQFKEDIISVLRWHQTQARHDIRQRQGRRARGQGPAFRARQFLQRDSRIGLERLTSRARSARPRTPMPKPFWAPAGNEGCKMTEPTDSDRDIAATSRRRFLWDGGALVGGPSSRVVSPEAKRWGASESAHNLPPRSRNG